MKLLFPFLLLFAQIQIGYSQQLLEVCEKTSSNYHLASQTSQKTNALDVIHYRLNVLVDPDTLFISGSNTIHYKILSKVSNEITIDLSDSLQIDSIIYHNALATYSHSNHEIRISVDSSLSLGGLDSVEIHYHGSPNRDGLGTFVQDSYNGLDSIIWTLSQPYGASGWWPCDNNLTDKADSIDILVSTPIKNQVASNGLLIKVDTLGVNARYHWKSSYPIASYLVAISVTNYEIQESKHPLRSDSIYFQHFLYPGDTISQQQSALVTLPFLQFFDSLFGPYPFIKEKYGHASFTYGGGMEHQTMSFMGNYGGELIAHELAHQWFGDQITCGSWTDLWLNEAFATYATMLTYEFGILHDPIYLPQILQGFRNISFLAPHESVYRSDTSDAAALFTRVPYHKGASLLHMIRFKIGDQAFFSAIQNYTKRADLNYAFAETKDLQSEFEQSSGQDLDEFFKDWFYGKGYPSYTATWAQDNGVLQIQLDQTQSDPSVYFFNMPVPYRVLGPNLDTLIILDPKFSGQLFQIPLNKSVDSLQFDPEKWIGAKSTVISSTEEILSNQVQFEVYPNPSNGIIYLKGKDLNSISSISLYNSAGEFIRPIKVQQRVSVQDLAAGIYYLKGIYKTNSFTKQIVIH